MNEIPTPVVVASLGFLAGLVFGATAQRTRFCTMGGITDMALMGDARRFRAWMLAIAVAIAATQTMAALGWIDLGDSLYATPRLNWLGAVIGGLLFGYGMTLAGGCGSRVLVRLGAGNLKSLLVVLVLAVSAYMTMRGLLAPLRIHLETATVMMLAAPQDLPSLTGWPRLWVGWAVALALAAWCFKDAAFRASRRDMAAGVIIGLLIPAGWAITGIIGYDDFEPTPLASLTFVAPVGDSVQYVMLFTGASLNFGIATVGGVVAGAGLAALLTREWRLEGFADTGDMARHVLGAALMGIGGVLALGCTIGQGMSGMSTLAAGSVIALAGIIAGGFLGVKSLEEGSLAAGLRALLKRG